MKIDRKAKPSPAGRAKRIRPPRPSTASPSSPSQAKGSGIWSGERSLAQKALRESEEKMRSIFRAAPVGIGVVVDRVFIDVNQRFCDLTGYTREELINKSARVVYPSDEDYQFVGREKYRQIADRETGAVETRFRRKDGRVIEVWLSSTPLDTSDLSRGVTFTALDITERKEAEERLRRSEAALRTAQQVSHVGSWAWHIQSNRLEWSDEMYQIYGIDRDSFTGDLADVISCAIHPDDRAEVERVNFSVIQDKKPIPLEYRVVWPDGTIRTVWAEAGELTLDDVGHPAVLTGIVQDITERKRAAEALSRTISLLEATLNSTADGILVVDLGGKIQRFNENFRMMWRIPPAILETGEDDRALGFVLDQLKDPEKFLSKVRQLYGEVLAESYDVLEFKDGRVFERSSRPQLLGDTPVGRVWSFRDVTERVKDEEKLRAALGEREVMLREIHHRVKNNIQIISSLLRLQSRYIRDEKALELLDESQNRIRSMALIHEKLYQSQDLSRIDFSDYIAKMITHLFAIYKIEFSRIRHRVEAKGIQLDINRAIPCGLIINELITNVLKHAFPEDREGEILVRMRPSDGDKYELTVKDNGAGLPEDFDPAKKGTLGFQIVNDLVKQLDGSIEIRRGPGTEIIIRF